METDTSISQKVTVIGLGKAGVNVVERLSALRQSSWLNLIAIDTDQSVLADCQVPTRICADRDWRHGEGCGGDPIKGQRSLARERSRISDELHDSSLVLVTGGLGGGVSTGGAPIVASVAKSQGIPSVFIMTMPFSMEGHGRHRVAEDGVRELLPLVDVLMCLPNDLLFSALPADAGVEEAFLKADLEVAKSVIGVSEIIRCRNLMSADFSDLKSLLHETKTSCCFGIGEAHEADGLNRCHLALERLLECPFLGGIEHLKKADAMLVSLLGGKDLSMGEMKKCFEAIERFAAPDARIVIGANTDDAYAGRLQLTVVTIEMDKDAQIQREQEPERGFTAVAPPHQRSAPAPVTAAPAGQAASLEQGTLPLVTISKGIFLNTTAAVYGHEDLDIPTFQRQSVIIDTGE